MRYLLLLSCLLSWTAFAEEFHDFAKRHKDTLLLSTYATVDNVVKLGEPEFQQRTLDALRKMGIQKVYLEVYRGITATPEQLTAARDFLKQHGFEVAAGIATVPGPEAGVRQNGAYDWFNWQSEKTQNDLEAIVRQSAPLFDEFIVDDFVCTDDTSEESNAARGDRSWGQYRRELLTEILKERFVKAAMEMNPDITMIIKYPQWYDLFHRFGYDPLNMSPLFDKVYVGTETRGPETQRFGFIPQYLGFNNFTWLASIAGEQKIGGAWFDHADCTGQEFVEQAWQSTLAGTDELVLFSMNALLDGHEGHELLRRDYPRLVELRKHLPVPEDQYIHAYKPANSEPFGDMYLLDFLGMLGLPILPKHNYPEGAKSVLITAGAVDDMDLVEKVKRSLKEGAHVTLTASLLGNSPELSELIFLAGLELLGGESAIESTQLYAGEGIDTVGTPLRLAAAIRAGAAEVLLAAKVGEERVPFLTRYVPEGYKGALFVLNSFTYTQDDFDRVGEVLLAPARLRLRDLPGSWCTALHEIYPGHALQSPAGVTWQPLKDGLVLMQNYNHMDEVVMLPEPMRNTYAEGEATKHHRIAARSPILLTR